MLNLLQCGSSKQKGSQQQVKKIILADHFKRFGEDSVSAEQTNQEEKIPQSQTELPNLKKQQHFGDMLGKAYQQLDTSWIHRGKGRSHKLQDLMVEKVVASLWSLAVTSGALRLPHGAQ